ncbi:DUF2188 domain-containing protein [Cupriavidus taiwanensis]|uniref:DUF2188 domain-containing protein n=1 Tax=Cupriavidus taiwanensis TaxID=164546 RepID=UPI001573D1E3|nr:DUF2188 domain-containing protein [Cupriavidus taiwanensis]NSX15638.1 DUF2188 domain-containing protein [Cupriavidus taiwanensis]
MPTKRNIHVVPAAEGWAVEVDGTPERSVYPSQMAAIAAAWKRARHDQVELVLHDRNGEVWARDTFDNEPPDA